MSSFVTSGSVVLEMWEQNTLLCHLLMQQLCTNRDIICRISKMALRWESVMESGTVI